MGNMCCRRVVYTPGGKDGEDSRCPAQLPPQCPPVKSPAMSYPGPMGDECAINELLEGRMDLEVVLPDGKTIRLNVERRTPMMDLLVQASSATKISPASHVIHVFEDKGGEGKPLPYKPSTPIGSLDTNTICIVSKKDSLLQPGGKRVHKAQHRPFEPTFRVQVHLPRNQLSVARVSPRMRIAELRDLVCREKGLEAGRYRLVRPLEPSQPLPEQLSLAEYGDTEITLLSNACIESHLCNSISHIMPYAKRVEEQRRKTGILRLLAEDDRQQKKMSAVDGLVVTAPPSKAPPRHKPKKRRPAPPPPEAAPSHSRQSSSDSSGYHEATSSFLHEDLSPPLRAEKASSDSSGVSSLDAKIPGPTLVQKKRKAPPPPHKSGRGRAPLPQKREQESRDQEEHQLLLKTKSLDQFSSDFREKESLMKTQSLDELTPAAQRNMWEEEDTKTRSLVEITGEVLVSETDQPPDHKETKKIDNFECAQQESTEKDILPVIGHEFPQAAQDCKLDLTAKEGKWEKDKAEDISNIPPELQDQLEDHDQVSLGVQEQLVNGIAQPDLIKKVDHLVENDFYHALMPPEQQCHISQTQIISVTATDLRKPLELKKNKVLEPVSRRMSEPLEQVKYRVTSRRESEPALVPEIHAIRRSPLIKLDSWETREPQIYSVKTPLILNKDREITKTGAVELRSDDLEKKSAPKEVERSRNSSLSEDKRRASLSRDEVTKAALTALNARIEQDVTQQEIAASIQEAFRSLDGARPSLLAIQQKERAHHKTGLPLTDDPSILEPPPRFRSADKEALVIDEVPPQATLLKRSSSLLNLTESRPKAAPSKSPKRVRQLQRSLSDLTSDDREEFEAEQERLQREYAKLQRQFILWQQQLLNNHAMLREECIMPQYARTLRQSHSLPEGEDYSTENTTPAPLVSRSLSYEPTKDRCSTLPRSAINIPSLEFGSITTHNGSSTLRSSKTKSYFKPPQVRASTKNRQRLPPEIRKEGDLDVTDDAKMLTTILPSFETLKLIRENGDEDVLSRLTPTPPTAKKGAEEIASPLHSSNNKRMNNGNGSSIILDGKCANGDTGLLFRRPTNGPKVTEHSLDTQPPRPPPLPVQKDPQKETSRAPCVRNGVERKNSIPEGDSREQLLTEIRKFGGRTALRKISLAS